MTSNVATLNSAIGLKADIATTYSKTDVDTKITGLIDNAPIALNTLRELASALSNDANYATTVQNQLAARHPRRPPRLLGPQSQMDR